MGAAEGASVVGATPLARSGAANVPGTSGAACRAWTRSPEPAVLLESGSEWDRDPELAVMLESGSECRDVCLEPVVLFDSAPHVVLKDAWLDGGPGGNEAWLDQDQAGPLKLAVLLDSGPDQDTRLEYAVLLESGGSVAHAPMRDAGCWAGSESGSTESSAWVCTGTWRALICRS